jgi:hypothetical protein
MRRLWPGWEARPPQFQDVILDVDAEFDGVFQRPHHVFATNHRE